MAIDLGNETWAAEDRAVRNLKPFWTCLVDITKSVLVLGKVIYDQLFADAVHFFLAGYQSQ